MCWNVSKELRIEQIITDSLNHYLKHNWYPEIKWCLCFSNIWPMSFVKTRTFNYELQEDHQTRQSKQMYTGWCCSTFVRKLLLYPLPIIRNRRCNSKSNVSSLKEISINNLIKQRLFWKLDYFSKLVVLKSSLSDQNIKLNITVLVI